MIEIKDKSLCCGCHACLNACPKQCIAMHEDNEGFLYPFVDKEKCIDCGLCEKVCPVINQGEPRKPLKVYAAKNRDEAIRMQSSSGGIFTLIAEKVIAEGGVVFGAKFNKQWEVIHAYTDNLNGLADFRGSKYVQSIIGNTYSEVLKFLKEGRKVLFSGTPCQIAGLKKFLRKEYENLLTIDVACHGVPSPMIWNIYLNETCSKIRGIKPDGKNSVHSAKGGEYKSCIEAISFRSKITGWKKFSFMLKPNFFNYDGKNTEKKISQKAADNIFMKGFLRNIYLRPSCYACAARFGKSGSDICIGDFWGVENFYPQFDDDKGISLLLVNSQNGLNAYNNITAESIESNYEYAIKYNPVLEHSVTIPKNKELFWKEFERNPTMDCVNKFTKTNAPLLLKIYYKCRLVASTIVKKIYN